MPAKPPAEKFVEYDFRDLAKADTTYQADAAQDLIDIGRKLADRKREGLKLYEPLPVQEEFHRSATRIRLLRGSNRGGKTMPAAVEVARCVTNADPHGKFPAEPSVVFVVGKDYDHIGQVIYKKLFRPGAYRIIRDRDTGLWRAFRPWDAEDAARRKASRPAPPLIPKRLIESIAWKEKKKHIPSSVTLRNGWQIRFFSGIASPPQGEAVALVWMDEEIANELWFAEMAVRVGEEGDLFLVWSATPQVGTLQFYDLCRKAQETAHLPAAERTVEEFFISLADNPHISERTKAQMEADLSEEQKRVRIKGDFSVGGQKIFAEFSLAVHGVAAFDIPDGWTNYMVVDPGHQVCAALFGSAPPPGFAKEFPRLGLEGCELVLWDELYIPACNAGLFAEAVERKYHGRSWQAFVIDTHGSRVHEAGSGLTIYQQYSDALKARGIRSEATGHGFAWGCDDPKAGIEATRRFLAIQPGPWKPKLRVMADADAQGRLTKRLRNFQWEVERYLYKKRGDLVTDEPDEQGRRTHLMACLRYLVMYGPKWVPPVRRAADLDPVVAAFLKQRRRGGGPKVTHFGPPAREGVA